MKRPLGLVQISRVLVDVGELRQLCVDALAGELDLVERRHWSNLGAWCDAAAATLRELGGRPELGQYRVLREEFALDPDRLRFALRKLGQ